MSAKDVKLPDPRIVILLGIPFHDVTMSETLSYIDAMVARRKPGYLATANLDFAAQASRDVELQRILFDASLVLCDGTPLVWASRWLQAPLRERVAGSDMMPHLFKHSEKTGHRIFFLGSSDEVLAEAVLKCREQYPKLTLCGTYSPPYAKLLELDRDEIARHIREAEPDILLVAFGCPKQEKWIYMNYKDLGVPVSVGIGASLDFIAGKFRRAPVWMRVCGLEWVFRMMQEPRRLVNRYFIDLMFFAYTLRRQRKLLRRGGIGTPVSKPAEVPASRTTVHCCWSGRVDAAAVDSGVIRAVAPEAGRPNVVIDCAEVTFIDSTGLGLFIKNFRTCKEAGGVFIVLNPSDSVAKMLEAMQLDRLIPLARNLDEIAALLKTGKPGGSELSYYSDETKTLTLVMSGDITAATVSGCEEMLVDAWSRSEKAAQLVMDLKAVSFIDSSGLGFLIKAFKLAKERGGKLSLLNLTPNVINVIKLANLQTFLEVPVP
ncbi:MAG: WecB/TagA/CpsF family glycosyltransferase [Verrucomicrobiota bacterium]